MTNFLRQAMLVLSCGVALSCVACNKMAGRAPVQGEIQIDGQPLMHGSILWVPIEGNPGVTTGGTIEQGKYRVDGEASPLAGTYRVEIRAPRKTGKMVPKPLAPPGEMVESEEESVAAEFNVASTLKAQLNPGENSHNFEVKSLPRRR